METTHEREGLITMINLQRMRKLNKSFQRILSGTEDLPELCRIEAAELQRMREQLREMLEQLPDLDGRMILSMMYLDSMKARDIAEEMHISLRYVFYLKNAALDDLRRLFPDEIALS